MGKIPGKDNEANILICVSYRQPKQHQEAEGIFCKQLRILTSTGPSSRGTSAFQSAGNTTE